MTLPNGEDAVGGFTTAQIDMLMTASQVLAEMVIGYRKKLIDGGVTAIVAEQMMTEFHRTLLEQMKPKADETQGKRPGGQRR